MILLLAAGGCVVAGGCGGSAGSSAGDRCQQAAGADGVIRSARGSAVRFAGDRQVGRLRWAAEHKFLESYGELGTPRHGVVPVTGGTDPESDYGAPTRHRMGVLRLRDGAVVWQRAGTFAPGPRSDDGGGDVLAGWMTRASRGGAFDVRTGRTLFCGLPRLAGVLDDGTAVSVGGQGVARLRVRDGGALWRRPTASKYQDVVVGDDVVAASTGGVNPAEDAMGRVGAFRLSDGKPLWDGAGGTALGVAEKRVVVAEGNRVVGRRADDGKVKWSRPVRRDDATTYTVADGRLLVAGHGKVTAYRATDGSVAWSVKARGLPDLSKAAESGGTVYAPIRERSGIAVVDVRRGKISTSLTKVIGDTYSRDIAVGGGALIVQDRNWTLAFDLPRAG